MNDSKKISAVGEATPATDIKNICKNSITGNCKKIKCVIQKPNEISEVVEIDNTVSGIEKIVSGIPETMVLDTSGLLMIHNRYGYSAVDGALLAHNITVNGIPISGTVLIASADLKNPDLSTQKIQSARAWLLKHSI